MTNHIIPPSPAEGPATDGLSAPPRAIDLTTAMAMQSLHDCRRPFADAQTADDMLIELHHALVTDADTQKLLFTHAHTLNAFFHRLITRAVDGKDINGNPTTHVSDRMTILALAAQRQCLQTIAALTTLRMIEKNTIQNEGGKK